MGFERISICNTERWWGALDQEACAASYSDLLAFPAKAEPMRRSLSGRNSLMHAQGKRKRLVCTSAPSDIHHVVSHRRACLQSAPAQATASSPTHRLLGPAPAASPAIQSTRTSRAGEAAGPGQPGEHRPVWGSAALPPLSPAQPGCRSSPPQLPRLWPRERCAHPEGGEGQPLAVPGRAGGGGIPGGRAGRG